MTYSTTDDWYRQQGRWVEQTMFAKLERAANARGNRFAWTWMQTLHTERGWVRA